MVNSPPQKTKGIYLHGPWVLSFKPTSEQILEVLFGPNEVVTVEIKGTKPEPTRRNKDGSIVYGLRTYGFSTGKKMFDNQYRLFGHPWGGSKLNHVGMFNFSPNLEIIGTVVAFKWFCYQNYEEYRDLLKQHVEIALSDKVPMAVLIDSSPPTENPRSFMVHTTDDGLSVSKIEEGSVEEVLASFRTPNEPELDRFLQYYGLGDNNLVIMDTTTSQSVIDAMAQSVKFFENP